MERARSDPAVAAFWLLRAAFTAAPILLDMDKFFDALADWSIYVAPAIDRLLPGSANDLMFAVGTVEIAAGVLVGLRPKIGGAVVGAWLAGIIVNLLLFGDFYDIALRDSGLLVGAISLSLLASRRSG